MTDYELEAIIMIRNYLNKDSLTDEYIQTNFQLAIKRLANRIEELDGIPNAISETKKGEESIMYSEKSIISEDIKRILPKPYLKFF